MLDELHLNIGGQPNHRDKRDYHALVGPPSDGTIIETNSCEVMDESNAGRTSSGVAGKSFAGFRLRLASVVLRWRVARGLGAPEVFLFGRLITRPAAINLFLRPFRSPPDAVVPYPVVRLARQAPVANRGVQRNRLAVKNEFPVRGSNRRYNFAPTAAATQVRCRCKADGDVNRPLLKLIGDEFDKFMFEAAFLLHCGRSSLISCVPSMLSWLLFSSSR